MHSAGFVHADVKPSNIVWSELKHRWLIIDFSDSHRVDAWGKFSCTAEWAPPEVILAYAAGHELIQYTIDFDLYSVAAVLWAQITGDRPFTPLLAAGHKAAHMGHDAVRKQVLHCSCAKLRGRHVAMLQTDSAHWHVLCRVVTMDDIAFCQEQAELLDSKVLHRVFTLTLAPASSPSSIAKSLPL